SPTRSRQGREPRCVPWCDSRATPSGRSSGSAAPFSTTPEVTLTPTDLSHRRFDDGDVLLRRSAADSDAGDHVPIGGQRHTPTHGGVSAAGDREEGIELRAWLHEWDEVSG